MKYSELVIYYFSGTGNSKNVAKWFSNTARENNISCSVINIAKTDRLTITPPSKDALLIFISPVHGFNYPPIMVNFIRRFPKGKNKIVLMNTRAGMLLGKFITPGVTGIAFLLSAALFKIKGYSIIGMKPVDLPSNWISIHPGLNEKTVIYLHEMNKKRVEEFSKKILKGKKDFKCFKEIVQDILVSPIALGYYLVGRFFLAKTYYASSDCNGCFSCIKNCPVKAIIKIDNRPYWTLNCESCMKCMSNCPQKAIETGHGFITGILLLFYNIILVCFYKMMSVYFFKIENERISTILDTALLMVFLTIGYRIFHYLLRFKVFNRIIVYTSLTKYKFWGRRYKALKNL